MRFSKSAERSMSVSVSALVSERMDSNSLFFWLRSTVFSSISAIVRSFSSRFASKSAVKLRIFFWLNSISSC